jgi:hypothetical protein
MALLRCEIFLPLEMGHTGYQKLINFMQIFKNVKNPPPRSKKKN